MKKAEKPDFFTRFTSKVSMILGHAWVFASALALLILWALSGPFLGFTETWQLVINTTTTIVTFLMVFIIQNTQNRDNLAMNIKLDAIMKKLKISEEELYEAEDESDKRLETKKEQMQKRSAKKSRSRK
jgi:low affinity Fe/Cu permease